MISICIPTYNSPRTFQRLLDSVLMQSYSDYEIIVSDDSTDKGIETIVKHCADKRILYYHNLAPLGTPENWNNAIRYAKGDYIKVMHHDDWFLTADSLQIMVDALESSQSDFVFCQCGGDGPNHPKRELVQHYIEKSLPLLLLDNTIGAPSATLYRRTSLLYDANIKYYVDVDFYIAYLISRKAKYIEQELIGIGTTPVRVTDAVVNNREFVYDEFQYVYLKLWNSRQWERNVLTDVFTKYIREHADFADYEVANLLTIQRILLLQMSIQNKWIQTKCEIKRLIK